MTFYRQPEEVKEGFEIYDERFSAMLVDGVSLEKHFDGMEWAEGPVYVPQGDYALVSDIPNNRIMKWSDSEGVSIFRKPSGYTNGHFIDLEGRLVSCEHGGRRISRTEEDGTVTNLVDNYKGKKLNSPNDLVVKSDGSIWFTDPPYGILSDREGHKGDSELGANYVFQFQPSSGEIEIACSDMDRPNGLAFSPDEKILYVADTGEPGNIVAYDVIDGKHLVNPREFAIVKPGKADGFRCDNNGNIFTSAWDGIQVYSPEAELLGKILVPEQRTANCCFGGPHGNRLYIAGDHSFYSIVLNACGVGY